MDELRLALPDWQHLDDVHQCKLPFVLWPVGEQPLLHHWLDHAVDQGASRVTLLCSDRPADVRSAMEEAELWPIDWELLPVARIDESAVDDVADHLPGHARPRRAPESGWELLDHWFALRRAWFDETMQRDEARVGLALGRFAQIHPTAEIRMPVWFGDQVQIGPGCQVGPYVSLGRGVVLEGPSLVENAVITEHTFLAGHTELRDAILDGGLLLNLRHRARVPKLDGLMADRLRSGQDLPPWRERLLAAALYAAGAPFQVVDGPANHVIQSFEGLRLETGNRGPLWRRRRRWLREVVRGRMRLWGPLPRSRDQLEALDSEWREVLESSKPGVFSYADLHGSHEADTDLEPIHAVFQATSSRDSMNVIFKENLWSLLRSNER
jgi:hypothetical protein